MLRLMTILVAIGVGVPAVMFAGKLFEIGAGVLQP